ncbi:hypothetical protein BpHYR1_038712 [Brachionus plicatilis]|uniref:Uncharacterized protein n=1 Tax=Brachionus plicatilis TaxID=10195 RepID=A0A3M7SAC4_BRAPC|nr:hypothetical protein BpHYR1_038712 [Brachionus plicatilis]
MKHLYMGLVHRFHVPCLGIDSERNGPVNAGHLDAVSGLDCVDQIVARKQRNGARGLTSRHLVRRLLKFDQLFVKKRAPVVDDFVGMVGVARLANSRLEYATTFQLDCAIGLANAAAKKSLGHLRNYVRETDDHSGHGYQLVDVRGVQSSHAGHFVNIVGPDPDVQLVIRKFGEVELFDSRVECFHYFDGVADQLLVQFDIEVF